MKRLIATILMICLLFSAAMAAEMPDLTAYTDDELAQLAAAVSEEQKARGINYETLQQGSKGEAVKALQKRLIELNYLSGGADGDFGGKTKSAIELFQKTAGMTATGIADAETQKAIFAEDAPEAKVYLNLDFKAISRDPGSYEGKNYKFSGKVLQVMEEDFYGLTYVSMRIATKGNYDNVVYVTYYRSEGEPRILEDDRVTVYGECKGLYSYTSTMRKEITLPKFSAESVTLK